MADDNDKPPGNLQGVNQPVANKKPVDVFGKLSAGKKPESRKDDPAAFAQQTRLEAALKSVEQSTPLTEQQIYNKGEITVDLEEILKDAAARVVKPTDS